MLPKLLIPHNAAPIWLHSEVIMAAIGLHRGSYQARIRRTGYPTITKTFVRKKDAVAWAVLSERKIEQDEYVADGLLEFVTLADLLERYQEEITPTKRSAEIEELRIGKLKRSWISKIRLRELQPYHIAKYRDERLKEIQGNAVTRDMSLISHAIDTAIKEWGFPIKRNPVQLVRKPLSNKSRDRRLEQEEQKVLLEELSKSENHWIKPVVEVAIETAMRRG